MKKNKKVWYKRFFLLFFSVILLMTTGAACSKKEEAPKPFTLTVWRTEDPDNSLSEIADAYQKQFEYVKFDFRTFKEEEYEEELLKAWAKGEGPDIFSVPNWRLGKFREFITPVPQKVTLKTLRHESKFGKTETIVEKKNIPLFTSSSVRDQFVEAVAQDVVYNGKVYGLPYSMDTLVMYYNRDLLSKSQIAVPPTNWEDFRDAVQAMVIIEETDETKTILRPAAALGTADNINYFFDVLSMLMLQNKTPLLGENPALNADKEGVYPAFQALEFYLKFSDALYATYTWDDEQLNSLEAFTQNNLGFYFGYYRDLDDIKSRAPNLNFSYTLIPQIDKENPVNYARYPIEAVSVTSKNPDHAWNFIAFAVSKDQVSKFLIKTERIPAIKSLIAEKQMDPILGVFSQQALTANSWYHGVEPDLALSALKELVNEANNRTTKLEELLNIASAKINLTLK